MVISQNFGAFYKSINNEFEVTQDRVRNLIGSDHWLTDGESKELICRNILKRFLPETLRATSGFIVFPPGLEPIQAEKASSGQLDLLISEKSSPTLYKEEDLVIVTPSAARSFIEVKTRFSSKSKLKKALEKLADAVGRLRRTIDKPDSFTVGLFAFNPRSEKKELEEQKDLLQLLAEVSKKDKDRVINFLCIGSSHFVRYWSSGKSVDNENMDSGWHCYKLADLARAYFVSNLIWSLTGNIPDSESRAYFPHIHGKELDRAYWIGLNGTEAQEFPNRPPDHNIFNDWP